MIFIYALLWYGTSSNTLAILFVRPQMKYFNLSPLQSDDELDEAIDLVDLMLDLELDQTESVFLDEISDLVWEYEHEHYPMLGVDE
jgi:hypothetical protein